MKKHVLENMNSIKKSLLTINLDDKFSRFNRRSFFKERNKFYFIEWVKAEHDFENDDYDNTTQKEMTKEEFYSTISLEKRKQSLITKLEKQIKEINNINNAKELNKFI